MPKGWYEQSANKIKNNDSPEEIERKKQYQSLCASKKPYFFIYNYPTEMQKYKSYTEKYELEAQMYWNMSLQELLVLENKNPQQINFIQSYLRNNPVDMSASTMNKICFMIEDYMKNFKLQPRQKFDYSILKSGKRYDNNLKREINKLYKEYKISVRTMVNECNEELTSENVPDYNEYKESIMDWFESECSYICQDPVMLCDILIDICYSGRNQKELVWTICGETIVENLLKHSNGSAQYPKKVETDAEFECMGNKFVMKDVDMVGENNG